MAIIYEGDPRADIEVYLSRGSTHSILGQARRLLRALSRYPIDTVRYLWIGAARMFDTTSFSERPDYLYKLETVRNWSSVPCGSSYSALNDFSKDHFGDIEAYRYKAHPWLRAILNSLDVQGKRVLEIGYGAGSDHAVLAQRGGEMHGIDLTPRSLEVTKAHLAVHGCTSKLVVGDAELLPYEVNYFDFVYSFGVIHHSPNTEQIVQEIHRVLKPGGKAFVTVYHKHSIFFWWSVFVLGFVVRGGWRRRTLRQQLSLIEHPNNNENMVIRLYTASQFKQLFKSFSQCTTYVRHLSPCDIDLVDLLYRDRVRQTPALAFLQRFLGWYVVAEVTK